MMIKIIRVLAKVIIRKFGSFTISQSINLLVPFLGLCLPIIEQVLEHTDVILKGAQMIKNVI